MDFPLDLIIDILCRLPVKTLLRFKCLSNFFGSLIDSPDFIKFHLSHSNKTNTNHSLIFSHDWYLKSSVSHVELDSPEKSVGLNHPFKDSEYCTVVLGSCNGLVAIENVSKGIALWNPSIKKHKIIPLTWSWTISDYEDDEVILDMFYYKYGFGYDAASDDYKLVRIWGFLGDQNPNVHVYSLKAASWRQIECGFYGFCGVYGEIGVHIDGVLHWCDEDYMIVAFDLKTENFNIVPLPQTRLATTTTYSYRNINVGVLGEYLSMHCDCCDRVNGRHVNLWVMKEYGVKESWTKLFSISEDRENIWVMKDYAMKESWTKILSLPELEENDDRVYPYADNIRFLTCYGIGNRRILFCLFHLSGYSLYCYDLHKQEVERIHIHDMSQDFSSTVIWNSSLVSPA